MSVTPALFGYSCQASAKNCFKGFMRNETAEAVGAR
jgi:hypothetical protein